MILEAPSVAKQLTLSEQRAIKLKELRARKAQLKGMLADCNSKVTALKVEVVEKR